MSNPATPYFPRRIILAGALVCGMLLALAVHMLGQRFGIDLGGFWTTDAVIPTASAVAWWLIATVAFTGGYLTAKVMDNAVAGKIPRGVRQLLIVVLVIVLAAAGQAAAAPSAVPTLTGLLAGVSALALGTLMAFCGAHFALRQA